MPDLGIGEAAAATAATAAAQEAAGAAIVASAQAAGAAGGYVAAAGAGSAEIAAGASAAAAANSAATLSLLGFGGTALTLLGIGGQTAANVQSAQMRAEIAKREEKSLRDAAIFNAQQSRRRAALAISKGVATGAASGLDVQFGSPLLFELDNVMQAEVEAQNILRSGTVGATGKEFESKLARSSIPGSIFSGVAQAGGSVLSSFIRRG